MSWADKNYLNKMSRARVSILKRNDSEDLS